MNTATTVDGNESLCTDRAVDGSPAKESKVGAIQAILLRKEAYDNLATQFRVSGDCETLEHVSERQQEHIDPHTIENLRVLRELRDDVARQIQQARVAIDAQIAALFAELMLAEAGIAVPGDVTLPVLGTCGHTKTMKVAHLKTIYVNHGKISAYVQVETGRGGSTSEEMFEVTGQGFFWRKDWDI